MKEKKIYKRVSKRSSTLATNLRESFETKKKRERSLKRYHRGVRVETKLQQFQRMTTGISGGSDACFVIESRQIELAKLLKRRGNLFAPT